MTLQKIPGFESTAYAYQGGRVVWAGLQPATDHPRSAWAPWKPPVLAQALDTTRLQAGAATCLALFSPAIGQQPADALLIRHIPYAAVAKGLLLWLTGQALPFPLNHAASRFDSVRHTLLQHDLPAFAEAAKRLLGLGHGLTPSGDDFVGGIMFTLSHLRHASPAQAWLGGLPQVARQLNQAAASSTNVISAALLEDLLAGSSYRVLHALLAALDSQDDASIQLATADLLALGASSGADLLAGVLVALTTLTSPTSSTSPPFFHPQPTRH